MKRILLTLAGTALLASAFAGTNIMRNTPGVDASLYNTATNFYGPGSVTWKYSGAPVAGEVATDPQMTERGEEVLAPSGTVLTEMSWAYITVHSPVNPLSTWRIRLYEEDLLPTVGGKNQPGTIKYDAIVANKPGWTCQRLAFQPSVTVSGAGKFAWTMMQGGNNPGTAPIYPASATTALIATDHMGLNFNGPPSLGSADNTMWRRFRNDVAAWTLQTFVGGSTGTWDPIGMTGASQPYGGVHSSFWTGSAAANTYNNGGTSVGYDNLASTGNQAQGYFFDSRPAGDDVSFEGPNREMAEFEFDYISDVLTPIGGETVTLKVYAIDLAADAGNPVSTGPIGTYSAPVTVFTPATLLTMKIPTPGLVCPDNVVYELSFSGGGIDQLTPGMIMGQELACSDPGASDKGMSMILFWIEDGLGVNGHDSYWFGVPTFNLASLGDPNDTFNATIANLSGRFTPSKLQPLVITKTRGGVISGTAADVLGSNDVRWSLRPGVVFSNLQDPVELEFVTTAPAATATALSATIEDQVTALAVRRKSSAYDYVGAAYVLLTSPYDPAFGGANTDQVKTYALTPATAIQAGTLEMKMKYGYRAIAAVFTYPWIVRIDDMHWSWTP